MNDWAAKTAEQIVEFVELEGDRLMSYANDGDGHFDYMGLRDRANFERRLALIIAVNAEPLVALLREARREHHGIDDEGDPCEKTNYLDGLHACTCGMDVWNAKIDAALEGR